MPVVLQHGPATGGVDDDRCVAAQRAHGRRGGPRSLVLEPGVHGERATTRGLVARRTDARTGSFEHALRGGVNVALPRVHHTTGEEPHRTAVGGRITGRNELWLAQR